MAEPKLLEVAFNFNMGVKADMGNYENTTGSWSETYRYGVEGLTPEEVESLRVDIVDKMESRISAAVAEFHSTHSRHSR
jgi:hypothetical protein